MRIDPAVVSISSPRPAAEPEAEGPGTVEPRPPQSSDDVQIAFG
jgi:hypothetical protein